MVLLLTLILMGLGMLLIVPLLSFMATGLHTTYAVYDPKAEELYAADAGVREAMWRIRNQDMYTLPSEVITTTVDNTTPLSENGKDISVQISTVQIATGNSTGSDNLTAYEIVSVATDNSTGHTTSIDALVYSVNLTCFADKILTSPNDVSPQSGGNITGNGHEMWLPNLDEPPEDWGGGGNPVTINDAPLNTTPIFGWPSASSLAEFYGDQVDKSAPPPTFIDANGVIEVSQNMIIPSFYYEGDVIIRKARGGGVPAGPLEVNLGGTVYIKGTLSIAKDITLDLYQNPTTADPSTNIDSDLGTVPAGTPALTVDNITAFPESGIILVGSPGQANSEYLRYSSISSFPVPQIVLEAQTTKEHLDGDPVRFFGRTPNTIFIEGDPGTWNFSSSTDCTINGPGAIIATGDIEFLPKVDADSGFVYVMALGTVKFQPATSSETPPSGFTGSVVARTFLPLHRSDYTYPPEGYPLNLNIPMGDTPTIIGGIAYWKIY